MLLLLTYFRKIDSYSSYLQLIGVELRADGSSQIFLLHMTLFSSRTLFFHLRLRLIFSSQCRIQQFHDATLMMHFFLIRANLFCGLVKLQVFRCFQSISQIILPIICFSWSANQPLPFLFEFPKNVFSFPYQGHFLAP